ncbi:MAG TPA: DUF2490 domain-containing protein [Chryseolinea sp.]|nr:DUF2490 domain-containing protein [Chryseolinea sp.]
MKKIFLKVLFFFILDMEAPLKAQTPESQFWAEYMLNYPFANSFNIENAFVYSTLASSPRWYALDFSPTLEYSLTQHIDLSLGCTFSYTAQTEDYNTFEIRPVLGSRIHFTPNKRILTRAFLRLEQRNFLNLDTDTWETVWRPRVRAELLVPINRKTPYEDKMWYGIADFEWLFSVEDVEERFANRLRARVGLGYRLSYTSRFEFIYMRQQSRSGIDEDYETSDNIFRFRYKQYLRKTKPTKLSGTGN